MSTSERFWSKVEKTRECWLWVGAKISGGYGSFKINRKTAMAHRVSWELANDSIPPNLHVLHRCDNPLCVRPSHLFLGTQKDNVADRVSKNRSSRGSKRHNTRLTERIVKKILKELMTHTGYGSRTKVAEKYGISLSAVSKMGVRKTWKHVTF